MVWLVGVVAALGLVLFLRKVFLDRPPGPGYMRLIYPKKNGRGVVREWVKLKEPHRFTSNGSAQLASYVDRVFASKTTFPTLSFFSLDGERGAALWRIDGGLTINLHFDTRTQTAEEARARAFFEGRHFSINHDYLAQYETIRVLSWWVAGSPAEITQLCERVLVELCGVDESEGLAILFEEQNRKNA